MPFEPYKPKTVEPSPDGLIAWLETMPPERKYDFTDAFNCLLCQFGRAILGVDDYAELRHTPPFDSGAILNIIGDCPWTFGAALERAKAVREGV